MKGSPAARPPQDAAGTARPHAVEPWPQGVSREPRMRISDVLAELAGDFPTLTSSKLRFLEEQGLVEPRRTAGRYRLYSAADVERVRYVLRQQRDRYLPLRVIAEQLGALDRGEETEPLLPRLAAAEGRRTGPHPVGRHTVASLADASGADEGLVVALVEAGVLESDASGHLDLWAIDVVRAAAALAEHGVEPRHLRGFRAAADRQVSVVEQIVAPLRGHRGGTGQAENLAAELGELCATFHTALLRGGVARLTR